MRAGWELQEIASYLGVSEATVSRDVAAIKRAVRVETQEAVREMVAEELAALDGDETALTVVEIDTATAKDPLIALPTYRVVDRREWVGAKHTTLYGTIVALARDVWKALYVVVDATGIRAGLASFLGEALGRHRCEVILFLFNRATKSKLGWEFLGVVESGRYKEYRTSDDGR